MGKGCEEMKKRIWITKGSELSCTVTVWAKKPVWCVNKKDPSGRSGHWSNADDTGLAGSSCCFSGDLDGMLRVKFRKLRGPEGFIAERILSINLPKGQDVKK